MGLPLTQEPFESNARIGNSPLQLTRTADTVPQRNVLLALGQQPLALTLGQLPLLQLQQRHHQRPTRLTVGRFNSQHGLKEYPRTSWLAALQL